MLAMYVFICVYIDVLGIGFEIMFRHAIVQSFNKSRTSDHIIFETHNLVDLVFRIYTPAALALGLRTLCRRNT